mmetsp:Transcript_53528/g.104699  ORF Transcript_53528/g.104699 Transcript_53528/m.104699 type:complete len:433 (+) Transcript_53528:267-1565(+)
MLQFVRRMARAQSYVIGQVPKLLGAPSLGARGSDGASNSLEEKKEVTRTFAATPSPSSAPARAPIFDHLAGLEGASTTYPVPRKPEIKNLLLVEKITRYEQYLYDQAEMQQIYKRYEFHDPLYVDDRIREKFPGMHQTYVAHKENVRKILELFEQEYKVQTTIVKAFFVERSHAVGRDAVVSIGGDGTFLDAASVVDGATMTIGINSDPERSEGRLCINRKGESIESVVHRIMQGDYSPVVRQRIQVTIVTENGHKRVLPHKPLNDVLVAEVECAPTLYAEISVDGSDFERQKNSGILVCTGTGSTAWNYNMGKVREDRVAQVVKEFLEMQPEYVRQSIVPVDVRVLRDNVNANLVFDPREAKLRYSVRESIENRVFSVKHASGFAQKVAVRPLSSGNVHLFLDGINKVALRHDETAELEVCSAGPLQTALR